MGEFPLDSLIAYLPQKPPSLFVDHVLSVMPMQRVEGDVTFPKGHRIFENHLPGEPLVPGVIVIEALAQIAGVALMAEGGEAVRGYLSEVGRTRFYRRILPDEQIHQHAELDQAFGDHARFAVRASVNGERAVVGTLTVTRKAES